jgi:hypothetical protein
MKVFKMPFSTKLLPVLALAVIMEPFIAQAHNAPHDGTMVSTPNSWVTDFGFQPSNTTVSRRTEVQMAPYNTAHDDTMPSTHKSWAMNFGFQPVNGKVS